MPLFDATCEHSHITHDVYFPGGDGEISAASRIGATACSTCGSTNLKKKWSTSPGRAADGNFEPIRVVDPITGAETRVSSEQGLQFMAERHAIATGKDPKSVVAYVKTEAETRAHKAANRDMIAASRRRFGLPVGEL